MATPLYYIGIALAVLATCMFNIVPVLQKDALDQMKEISMNNLKDTIKLMLHSKKWMLGLAIGILGGIPYTLALNWTGIGVVQPLMPFGFIVLVIAANRMLHEKLTLKAKFAIFLMILLPIFVTLGDVSLPNADVTESEIQIRIIYFTIIVIGIIIVAWILTKKYPVFYTLVVGFFFAMGTVYSQIALSMLYFNGYDLFGDLGYLLENIFIEKFVMWALIMGIICGVFTAFAGITSQIGLQKVAASKFNPIQQTLNTLLTTGAGILLFLQFVNFWIFYLFGVICALVGTFILGQYQLPEKDLSKIEKK